MDPKHLFGIGRAARGLAAVGGLTLSVLTLSVLAPGAGAQGTTPGATTPAPGAPPGGVRVESVMQLPQAPGNLTILPDGRRIISLLPFYTPQRVIAEVRGAGELVDYPPRGEGALPGIASVLGIRSDTAGALYVLDNGLQGKAPSKMVVWDTRANRLLRTIDLKAVADTNSLLQDWAFDQKRQQLYMADPAGGTNAALVVVDLKTGGARRVLQGDRSVVNEDSTLVTEGRQLRTKLPDGRVIQPKLGVDGIAIDYAREWVYYGAVQSRTMYRVRAADLANPALSSADLAARVERYAAKPKSDGMLLDRAGNIYLGDDEHNAFGVITASDRTYHELARGPQYQWVDDFEFGTDGYLYVVCSQLHRSPQFNAGKADPQLPFQIFRFRPLAPGRQGY